MSAPKADPEVTLHCSDVNEALRRVAANSLEVAAAELEQQTRNHPSEQLDPGRGWSVVWLQTLCNSLRAGEEKDHDAYTRSD